MARLFQSLLIELRVLLEEAREIFVLTLLLAGPALGRRPLASYLVDLESVASPLSSTDAPRSSPSIVIAHAVVAPARSARFPRERVRQTWTQTWTWPRTWPRPSRAPDSSLPSRGVRLSPSRARARSLAEELFDNPSSELCVCGLLCSSRARRRHRASLARDGVRATGAMRCRDGRDPTHRDRSTTNDDERRREEKISLLSALPSRARRASSRARAHECRPPSARPSTPRGFLQLFRLDFRTRR